MAKAWKGVLKDDASFASMPDIKEGLVITLMGSADPGLVKPAQATFFVEDLPASAGVNAGMSLPAGIKNMGNTCYANSTLEALRAVPELKSSLLSYRGGSGSGTSTSSSTGAGAKTPFSPVTAGLADLLAQLEASHEAVAPSAFLTRVRGVFPQFGEVGPGGIPKQQDAEEFHNALLTALKGELTAPSSAVPALTSLQASDSGAGAASSSSSGSRGGNVIDTLFGLAFEETHACKECPEEPPAVRRDVGHKLQCNIDGGAGKAVQVNHLHEGVLHGLSGELEKRSEILDRNAVWARTQRIARLPRYLNIQMMRFYWKATPDSRDHTGVKCKMLRPVSFPADSLDVYDWCSESLQGALKVHRDAYADANVFGVASKKQKTSEGGSSPTAGVDGAGAPMAVEEDSELAAALAMSMGGAGASQESLLGPGLPKEFRGIYGAYHDGRVELTDWRAS